MKIRLLIVAASLVALAGCSTTRSARDSVRNTDPETVMVTYHVKPGNEAELQAVLLRAWELYRREHYVFTEPHLIVRDTESGGKPRFVEIFTWVSRSTPENAPESVKTIWKQEESLCERRDGHYAIEPGEVALVVPSRK